MRVFNKEKSIELNDYDLNAGYLKDDQLTIIIPEQKAIEEQSHFETLCEYENGGKDVKKVIDIQGQPYIPEHVEYEKIKIYIPYTAQELKIIENNKKLNKLTDWFDNFFDKQLNQSLWQKDFKVSYDEYFKKSYADMEELKTQAEIVRNEIKSLRDL